MAFFCFNLINKNVALTIYSLYNIGKLIAMAFTIEQYNTLEAAYATGATTVKYADKEVTYRSTKEMLGILNTMRSELFGNKPVKNKLAECSKGI